jgi:hypothetical protein
VTELHERALSKTGKARFQFPSGLWLPLDFFDTAQRNYRVITGSLKETQSQGTQHFILGNPHGEENPTKTSSIIDCQYNAKT